MSSNTNYLKIKTTTEQIEILTNGDMMKIVPPIMVYVLNYIKIDDLTELIGMLEVEEFTVEEIVKRYPLTKNVNFKIIQDSSKFRIYSEGFKRKDLLVLTLISLLLLSKENRIFLHESVLFPLYQDKDFLALEHKEKVKWIADVISEEES